MAAILEVMPPAGGEYRVPVGNTATIGRSAGNDVVLAGCSLVSRQHAVIRRHNGPEYQLMDLGSRNGTYVGGSRVVLPVPLQDGARIRIGGTEIIFHQGALPGFHELDEVTLAGGTEHGLSRVCQAAILVCDIRGFTGFSEMLPVGVLGRVLGEWFREAGNRVQVSGGVVDKFIGDAMLAYWIDGEGGRESCACALAVADGLLMAAGRLRWPESGRPFRISIALHYGHVSQGNIGLVAQRDATIIGDAVNVAFRIEGVMKAMGLGMALSEAFHRKLDGPGRFADYGKVRLKGKSEDVGIFGLMIDDIVC